MNILAIIFMVFTALHALIHLAGFAAYWPLAKIAALPYKTALLGGRLEVGAGGMRLYSLVWLLAALGLLAAVAALAGGKAGWAPLLLGAVLLSLLICVFDWRAAFRGVLIDLALLLVLGVVFGLRVKPAPFPAYTAPAGAIQSVPLPAGLPKPVERFYRQAYGDQIPVYQSAVFTGRGTIRFMGITFPARLRFTHLAGHGYHHYMECTFYGLPVIKVDEHFLDGRSRFVLPFGVVDNDPHTNSAANQGLWAETIYYPAVFVTDPRVRWEAVDDQTARLFVPFGDSQQMFTVMFDPHSAAMTRIETDARYRDSKSEPLRWWGEVLPGKSQNDLSGPIGFAVNWADENSPWLVGQIEEAVFNADVSATIRQSGL
jgi:hypothetical protein